MVVWLYILSCACTLFSYLLPMFIRGGAVVSSLVTIIVTLVVDAFVIGLILKNKKNKVLFIIYAISCASSLLLMIVGFSIASLIGFLASLFSTFIVGAVTMPQFAKYKDLAKKLYFGPAALALVGGIISTVQIIGYLPDNFAMNIFTSCLLSPALSFFFASWCVKEEEEATAPSKKQKGLFKVFVIIAVVCVVLGLIMSVVNKVKSEQNDTTSENSVAATEPYTSSGSSSSGSSYGSSYGSSSSGSSYGSSSSSSDKKYGAGGYEMPNENDKSFADYVQRVDPDLYDAMQDNYNAAADDYYSSSNSNKNSQGFVGSDGEYHNYVPEFGDDVNNWMADNW